MNTTMRQITGIPIVCAAVLLFLVTVSAEAVIDGIEDTTFNLTARVDHISTPDGGSPMIWGYANGAGRAQYPGPTMIVNQGDTVTVNLSNELDMPVSIVFPGQSITAAEVAAPSAEGLLTLEAGPPIGATPGGTVSYTFTATNPGTYLYHSGTRSELQVEMGLVGALIVRPSAGADHAYNHPDTRFDREYLFFLSEMDPRIHHTVEFQGVTALESTDYLSDYFPNYWFINGRNAPDTMAAAGVPWLPTQPYNIMPRVHPGEKLLMRVVGAGRDLHPFHHHGNHTRIIAKDGRLLESVPGLGPDLSYEVFTIQSVPGETVDAIFEWTGKRMGWDIYGSAAAGEELVHDCIDLLDNKTGAAVPDGFADLTSDFPWEYCADHDKPLPVTLPENQDLTFGGFYSGSPFLGVAGALPPGEGGLNPNGGYPFMWHTHTEKEMTNYDIFPGGMMTMFIVEAPGVPLD